jgi:hypothetical protein
MAIACSVPADTAEGRTIQDEGLRLRLLRAVFPGAEISRLRSQAVQRDTPNTKRSPGDGKSDAFVGEPKYSVRGPVLNEAEDCASEDVVTGKKSVTREPRMPVLPVPGAATRSFAAALQYAFVGVQAAGACWSIGMAARLTETEGRGLAVQWQYLFEMSHHRGIGSIRMIDLGGDGHDRLVVNSDWGGAGVAWSSSSIFDLRDGALRPVFIGQSAVNGDAGIAIVKIDITRTRLNGARSFCLIRKALFDPEHPSPEPKIYAIAIPPDSGLAKTAGGRIG